MLLPLSLSNLDCFLFFIFLSISFTRFIIHTHNCFFVGLLFRFIFLTRISFSFTMQNIHRKSSLTLFHSLTLCCFFIHHQHQVIISSLYSSIILITVFFFSSVFFQHLDPEDNEDEVSTISVNRKYPLFCYS